MIKWVLILSPDRALIMRQHHITSTLSVDKYTLF